MGERGPMGLQGPPGKGADLDELYRPLEFFGCARLLDLIGGGGAVGADGTTETSLQYTMLRYSNGDLAITCASGLGSAETASDSLYYPAPTPGAMNGICVAAGTDYPQSTQDVIAGAWKYELTPQPHATYSDAPSHWLNGSSFTFGANDCRAFVANARGDWMDAALSDVL